MAISTDQFNRAGIHAVGAIFTRLGWAFLEQPTSDYRIDGQAEKLNPDGKAGGKLIALQIKTGAHGAPSFAMTSNLNRSREGPHFLSARNLS
jgi:hypothetical protein